MVEEEAAKAKMVEEVEKKEAEEEEEVTFEAQADLVSELWQMVLRVLTCASF